MKKRDQKYIYIPKNMWLKSLGIMIGLVCILSTPGQAIWLGQSQVNPYMELQGVYESNVFQTNTDEKSDFITVISPGVHLEFPTAKDSLYRLLANYRANIKFYGNNGDSTIDPDEELNTVEHRLDGQVQFNLASGFKFTTGYILNVTSTYPDFPGDMRHKYKEHSALAQAAYAFVDRYELQLRYDGTFKRFDESADQDDNITAHRVEATLFYRLSPSLSLLGGGGYAKVDREEPTFSDSTEYRGFGGVRFEMTWLLTGILKAGVLSKDFKSEAFNDTTEAYVSGELVADFSETTKLSLKVQRDIAETALAENAAINGSYSVATELQADLTYTLTALPNLSLTGSVAFRTEKYPEDINDRSDNSLEVGVGAEYKFFKYVMVGGKFSYSKTDSNIDVNDFTDNIAMLRIRALL
jgi:opacity protein-like surface antigen